MTQVGEKTIKVKTTNCTCDLQQNGQTEGHPIDVATGRVFTVAKELTFARPFMLKIFRTWLSTNKDRKALFGPGWSSLLDSAIEVWPNDITYYDDEYQAIEFDKIQIGQSAKAPGQAVTLTRYEDSMAVADGQGRTFHFAMDRDSGKSRLEWITKNGIDLIYLEYEKGLLCAIMDAAGIHYPITRDHRNRITAIHRRASGQKPVRLRQYDYDQDDRLTLVRDELGHTTTYGYNDANLLVRETDRNGFSFYYEYDSQNRCIKNVGDNGKYLRAFQYLPEQNKTVVTDAHGHQKTYYYKYTGLVEMTVDALGHSSQRHHDENGHLISQIDKNHNIINYENDELGRPVERLDPLNNRWRTAYNGVRITRTDPLDNAITQIRDPAGRLIREQDQNGHGIEHHYDALGRKRPGCGDLLHREYDPWRRLLRQSDPLGHQTRICYDPRGRITEHFDALDQRTGFDYDPEDNLTAVTDSLGHTHRFVYKDNRERIENIDPNNTTTRFSYNLEGRIERITNADNHTHYLTYDPLNRLIKQIGFDGQVTRFSYDPKGNITGVAKADGARFKIEYNRIYLPVKITATDPSGVVSQNEYAYDAFSRRIAKKADGKQTRFYWDQFRMTAENSDQSQTCYIYYPNTFVPLCCHEDGDSYFYQTDHLGTPMEITDAHGKLVWLAAYDTCGVCRTSETCTFENNLRSQGQYHDKETGLHYNCFRYYDPVAQRYISQDPIDYASGDYNLYRYCHNDPVNLVDPVGLEPIAISFAAYAAVTFLMTVTLGLVAKQYIENNPPILKSDPWPGNEPNTDANSDAGEKCEGADPGNDDGDENDGDNKKDTSKRKYESSPKHKSQKVGDVGPEPKNPESSLENSVQVKDTSPRRIGVDVENGEFVVFDETYPGSNVFHGHVRTWPELTQKMQSVLRQVGKVTGKGKIIQ